MVVSDNQVEVERAFRSAYQQRHGKHLKEFSYLGEGHYRINGIEFNEIEVAAMLDTLENEISEINHSVISRLIKFFGGKRV